MLKALKRKNRRVSSPAEQIMISTKSSCSLSDPDPTNSLRPMLASSCMNICTGSNFSNKLPSLCALDLHKTSPSKHFTTIAGLRAVANNSFRIRRKQIRYDEGSCCQHKVTLSFILCSLLYCKAFQGEFSINTTKWIFDEWKGCNRGY